MGRGFNALFQKAKDRNYFCFAGIGFISSMSCLQLCKTMDKWKSEQKWLGAEGQNGGLEYTAEGYRIVRELLSAR